MQLFYTPNPKSDILDGDEFYHCVKSLRKKVGDIIFTTDGKGNLFKTKIEKNDIGYSVADNKKLKKYHAV